MNPSSGNLHPTEAYLISGPISASPHGLLPAGVYHYAPKSHALELLARIKEESWQEMEEEHADLLLAIHTDGSKPQLSLQSSDISKLKLEREPVRANVLSFGHAPWALIDQISEAGKNRLPVKSTLQSTLLHLPCRDLAKCIMIFPTGTTNCCAVGAVLRSWMA